MTLFITMCGVGVTVLLVSNTIYSLIFRYLYMDRLFDLVIIGMFLLPFFLFLALLVAAIRWLWFHAKD